MEYYSAIKRNEILIHATTWMNLENIMLSERSKTPNIIYCIIPFYLFIYLFIFLTMPQGMRDLPQPRIKHVPPALGAQSLNHWTTREVLIPFI